MKICLAEAVINVSEQDLVYLAMVLLIISKAVDCYTNHNNMNIQRFKRLSKQTKFQVSINQCLKYFAVCMNMDKN